MAHVLAMESRPLALELYSLLRQLDPITWRDELADGASERLRRLTDALHALADRFEDTEDLTVGEGQEAQLLEQIETLADELDELCPPPGLENKRERRRAWMALRRAALPRYEQLVQVLRAEKVEVPSIRGTNWARSGFHVLSGLVALAVVQLLPASWLLPLAASTAVAGWSMEASRRLSPAVNRVLMRVFSKVAHPSEEHGVNSSTWYVTALTVIAALGEPAACAVAVLVLALADPIAALVGRRYGTITLVHGRSLQGSLGFFVVALGCALAVLVGLYPEHPAPVVVALAAALPATVAELVSRRLDDNFTIPVSAAVGAWAALTLLG